MVKEREFSFFHRQLVIAGLIVADAVPGGAAVTGEVVDRIDVRFGLEKPVSHRRALFFRTDFSFVSRT